MDIRHRILTAALQVFSETGYRGATTRRIAQVADVNEVTLFRHFGSKEELLREALKLIASEGDGIALPDQPAHPERELTRWARAHYGNLSRLAPVIRTCMREGLEHPEMAKCAQNQPMRVSTELRIYLRRLQELGLADEGFDVGTATSMLIGSLFHDAMGRDIMPELFSYSPEQAPARYVKLFLRAIGAQRAAANPVSKARLQ